MTTPLTTDLTPTERLIYMSLLIAPRQTETELLASTATRSVKHLRRSLRIMMMARIVTAATPATTPATYVATSTPAVPITPIMGSPLRA